MNELTFRNDSETVIPDSLKQHLTKAARQVAAQLRADGQAYESMKDAVVVLGLFSDGIERYTIMPKTDLRRCLTQLTAEYSTLKWQGEVPELPRESLIERCLAPTPVGAVRVLWMTLGYNGTLQLHLDAAPAMPPTVQERLAGTVKEAEKYLNREQQDLAKEIHDKIKELPIKDAMQVLEDAELASSAELAALRRIRAELGEAQEDVVRSFIQKLPDFRERWKSVIARVKKVVIPPDTTTANNVEATLMAAAYVFDKVTEGTGLSKEEVSFLIGHFATDDPALTKLLNRMMGALRGKAFSGRLQDFSIDWMKQGFPKLEVGQKLAASLALTDVPDDIEVVAPWKAWSLIVPPGLFGEPSPKEGDIGRLWCVGTEIKFVVLTKGGLVGEVNEHRLHEIFDESGCNRLWSSLNSLVKGACLALSNPDDYKRETLKDRHSKASKKQRDGEPDFSVSRFMLSAPVQVDLRQTLLDEIAGKKRATGGGSPTVQFFVRGHWRNQAHGPGRSLRKQIRIEGFWKGPEEGRVLLRNYKVKDEAIEEAPQDTASTPTARS